MFGFAVFLGLYVYELAPHVLISKPLQYVLTSSVVNSSPSSVQPPYSSFRRVFLAILFSAARVL